MNQVINETRQRLAAVSETATLDAQVLLAHVLEKPRSWILAHPSELVDEDQYRRIKRLASRLQSGEPLPYLIGRWEFFGLDFTLSPAVLIPRPETELLVEHALNWLEMHPHLRFLLDLGTGSGCIAVALASHCTGAHGLATDISQAALQVARLNIQRHRVSSRVHLLQCDLIPPSATPFDLICANLPYIPSKSLPELTVARREPQLALDGGAGGLKWIRRLLEGAPSSLARGGLVLLEIEASQGQQVLDLACSAFPHAEVLLFKDLSSQDRLVSIQTR